MIHIGASDYRNGAKERLEEAFNLLRREQLAGGVYLAGRAVEGMLRALIWKTDREYATGKKSLTTGHDLRELLELVRNLGILQDQELRTSLPIEVQKVARLWWNNLRFCPGEKLKTAWYNLGEVRGRRTLKLAAREYYQTCSTILKRCEALWH